MLCRATRTIQLGCDYFSLSSSEEPSRADWCAEHDASLALLALVDEVPWRPEVLKFGIIFFVGLDSNGNGFSYDDCRHMVMAFRLVVGKF